MIFGALIAIFISALIWIRQSIPYKDSKQLLSATISVDSTWSLGPAVGIYDKRSGKYYWLKSMTSSDPPRLDTLRSMEISIRYMKFLTGPLENRIFYIKVDSTVVFDQLLDVK